MGLGQAELATKVGTSRLWITEIERGKPRASLVLVLRALSALGLELSTDDEGRKEEEIKENSKDALASEILKRQS